MKHGKPKVLIIATSRKTRGGITAVLKAYEQSWLWNEYNCEWIETVRDGNSIRKVLYFIRALLLFSSKIICTDIVHAHLTYGISSVRKNIFISLAKLARKKVVIHFHAAEKPKLNLKQKSRLANIYSKADSIIALSNNWKEYLSDTFNINKNDIEVIYNPAPKINRDNNKSKKAILFAGTLIKRKGYDTLIKAFARIANMESVKDWSLVLAGNGEIDEAQELIAKYNLHSRISLPGWVNGEEKEELFSTSSIFCLPSLAEGFPMAILDAWAYGLPCVVTPVGGIPELITDNIDGLIVPTSDDASLGNALLSLIESEEKRMEIVRNTDYKIANQFNLDIIASKLGMIYDNLMIKSC